MPSVSMADDLTP